MTDPVPAASALPSLPLRSALVVGRKPRDFTFAPDDGARAAIAAALGLLELPRLTFTGTLAPLGRSDLRLLAELRAEVVQPCTVTLAPVASPIKESCDRRFVQDFREPEAEEFEIPADDVEALPEVIDLAAVAIEALALALPLYPRAEGAAFGQASFAAPGTAPLQPEDMKPFAGLAEKLKKPE